MRNIIPFIFLASSLMAQPVEDPCVYGDVGCPDDWNSCGSNISVEADFLLLKACPDGFYVAAKQKIIKSTVTDTVPVQFEREVDTHGINESWTPGIRAGIFYQPSENCCWDAALKWSYIAPDHANSVTPGDGEIVLPFRLHSQFDNVMTLLGDIGADPQFTVDHVKGKWDLSLVSVEAELGRKYWVGNCFSIRPHVDFRFATIDQTLEINSEGTIIAEEFTADFKEIQKFENRFTGIGPRVGFELEWDIGCGAGLYGSSAFSLLYGDRQAKGEVTGIRSNVVQGESPADQFNTEGCHLHTDDKNNKHCSRPITDLDIGLYYTSALCEGRYQIKFKLGWEHHYIFNQGVADAGAAFSLQSKEESGAVSLQGLKASAHFNF